MAAEGVGLSMIRVGCCGWPVGRVEHFKHFALARRSMMPDASSGSLADACQLLVRTPQIFEAFGSLIWPRRKDYTESGLWDSD